VMWGWFVVPLGLPSIGIAAAMGLGFLAHILLSRETQVTADRESIEIVGLSIVVSAVSLLFGFIVHFFI